MFMIPPPLIRPVAPLVKTRAKNYETPVMTKSLSQVKKKVGSSDSSMQKKAEQATSISSFLAC